MATQTTDFLNTTSTSPTKGRPLLIVYARLATTTAGNLTTDLDAGSPLDGETIAEGDVILEKDNASGALRGLYVAPAASGTATRHHLMPVGAEVHGVCVRVLEGTANGNKTFWCCAASGAATVGTDALTFAVDDGGVADHGALTGLLDDDHSQYALLAGRSGGQTQKGGTDSGDALVLESTNHATKGHVRLAADNALRLPEMTAPGTPASGHVYLYAKSDGKAYIKDDTGTETDLTATGGGGGGGDSVTVNGSAVTDADFDDATPAAPTTLLGTGQNVVWQKDASSPANVSAHIVVPTLRTPHVAQGRLTLVSGSPISTADTTGATVYWSPYDGNLVRPYYSSAWRTVPCPEIALVMSGLTSGRGQDFFLFLNPATPSSTNTSTDTLTFSATPSWATGAAVQADATGGGLTAGTWYWYRSASSTTGTLHSTLAGALANTGKVDLTASVTQQLVGISLERVQWTSGTARATAYTELDGVKVKSGDTTRLLVGSCLATSTTETKDRSDGFRLLWNLYNRVERSTKAYPTTDYWQTNGGAWRAADGNTANAVQFFSGLGDSGIVVDGQLMAYGGYEAVCIGVNSSTGGPTAGDVWSCIPGNTAHHALPCKHSGIARLGESTYYLCERPNNGFIFGDYTNNGTNPDLQSAIHGRMVM